MSKQPNPIKANKPRSSLMEHNLQGIREGCRHRAKSWGGNNYDRRAGKSIPKD